MQQQLTAGCSTSGATCLHRNVLRSRAQSRHVLRHRAAVQPCRAGMGIGFVPEDEKPASSHDDGLVVPKALYGLTPTQMAAMGLTNEASVRRSEPREETLRAAYWYPGEHVDMNSRMVVKMSAGTGAAPGQAPPDLPSLLLDARICYIGMPLVPQVTELVISELLWLNYSNNQKPVFVYINSIGSQTADGQAVALDQEAYAILDTLGYIKPDVHTVCCGQAYGNAAMILASGKKGCRYALPNSRIMTAPPRMNRAFGSTANVMIKANELEFTTDQYVDFMSKFTGREDKEQLKQDLSRNRYFTPEQAIEFGIIDQVVNKKESTGFLEAKDYERQLAMAQAQSRGGRQGGGAGAEAGM